MEYPVHSPDSATGTAKEFLAEAASTLGFVPNLYGVMAGAPALLEGYRALSDIFDRTSFTAPERQVILLAVSYENRCDYCMAAHTAIAAMQGLAEDAIAR